MRNIRTTMLALSLGIVGFTTVSTSANEIKEKNVTVQVQKFNDAETKIDLDVNGRAEVFNLPELNVGESKQIVTENGNTILVARSTNGYSVDIDGEVINLPHVGGEMSAKIVREMMPLHTKNDNQIQVIGDLNEEQIAIIKEGFAAAGVNKEIRFSKGHEMKFITIGEDGGDYEYEFSNSHDVDIETLVSEGGGEGEHQIKIIKMGDNDNTQMKKKVFVIKKSEKSDN